MTGRVTPVTQFDVFLSSAPDDGDLGTAIAGALRDRGLRVRFPERRRGDLETAHNAIVSSLPNSLLFVAVFTRRYAARRDCQTELTAALLARHSAAESLQHVLVINPESETDHIAPPELLNALHDSAPAPNDREDLAELAAQVERRARERTGPMGAGGMPSAIPLHGIHSLDADGFTGRYDTLWSTHTQLGEPSGGKDTQLDGAVVVLHGPDGIGKTSLAHEYAVRFSPAYPGGVFWLRAYGAGNSDRPMGAEERNAERDRQIREMAADLGVIIANRSPTEIRLALDDALERRREACLWIVDDLTPGLENGELRRWLGPPSVAKTIITTDSEEYGRVGPSLEIGPLASDDAYHLLTSHREPVDIFEERRAARQLVDDLSGHPLAVTVLGAGLRVDPDFYSFIALNDTLSEPGEEELALAIELEQTVPEGSEIGVACTLRRAIERLDEPGLDCLRVASVLAAAPVPATLFAAALQKVDGLEAANARRTAAEAIEFVIARGLAQRAAGPTDAISVHPLVSRAVAFMETNRTRTALLAAGAVLSLLDKLPKRYDPTAYAAVEFEITHARELVHRATTVAEAELLGRVARYDLVRGAYPSGASLYRRQLETFQRFYQNDHPETVGAMSNLAGACFVTGDFAAARKLHEEVVQIRRQAPGEEHPDTLTAMSNLAATVSIEGDLERARDLQEEMLAIRSRVHGQEDPKTTGSAWNLFLTLNEIDDSIAAESVFSEHLSWLLDREPSTLKSEQRRIRDAVADMAVQNKTLRSRAWGAVRRD